MIGEISLFTKIKSQWVQKVPERFRVAIVGGLGVVVACLVGYHWFRNEKNTQKV